MSAVLHRPEAAAATIASINPATEVELARFDVHSPAEVDGALAAAVKAQAAGREAPITERVKLLRHMAEVLRAGKARYGREFGTYGIKEFVNIKTVWIGPAQADSSLPRTKGD